MKRLFAVLAAVLILTLTYGENSSSMNYNPIVIDDVQFDHPWGGDREPLDPPSGQSVTPIVKQEFSLIRIIKYWNYRFIVGSYMLSPTEATGTTTSSTTQDAVTNTSSSQPTNQRGTGQ